MPIARRHLPLPRRRRAAETAAAAVVAALAVPAMPAAATTPDCGSRFTAQSQADLARISVLDASLLAKGLPSLADTRLASAQGTVDSAAKPHKSIATARSVEARLPGLSSGRAAAVAKAPSRSGPARIDLAGAGIAGLATVQTGTAKAEATWTDTYRCGATGPLTRSAATLGGLALLDGHGRVPAMRAIDELTRHADVTCLLKVGPTGSAQSATDLVRLGKGRIGVRSGAAVALGDLRLFPGTHQEIEIKVRTQPSLEVTAASDPKRSKVHYRPAVLQVSSGGRTVHTLDEAGAEVALSLVGGLGKDHASALAVRLSLGEADEHVNGRSARAKAASLRVEVKLGSHHVLDMALGNLSVSARAPEPGREKPDAEEPDRGTPGYEKPGGRRAAEPGHGHTPDPVRTASPQPSAATAPGEPQPSAATTPAAPGQPQPSATTPGTPGKPSRPAQPATTPVALGEPVPPSGGTGAGALPLTGANVAVLGVGGAGLILAGVVALLLGRRRRDTPQS